MTQPQPSQGYSAPILSEARLQHALKLQRKGKTLTEISDNMCLDRKIIVNALYWQRVQS